MCFLLVTHSLPLNTMLQLSTCPTSVLSMSFYFGVLASGEAAPHGHSRLAIPRGSKHAFCMHTQPSIAQTPDTASIGFSHLDYTPPALIIPGIGTRKLRTAPVPQRPLKLFKQASPSPPEPASPAWPTSSWESHHEVSCPCFPFLLLPPDQPWGFPM